MKSLLAVPLTKEEKRVARKAVKRWGVTDEAPSFGDVLDSLTPQYACRVQRSHEITGEPYLANNRVPCSDREQVARWHRVKNYAYSLLSEQEKDTRPLHRRTPSDPTRPSAKRTVLCPGCEKHYKTPGAKVCKACKRAKAKPCKRDGCNEPCPNWQRTYCSSECHKLAKQVKPMAICLRPKCNKRVNTRSAKYCSQKCGFEHKKGTTKPQACEMCNTTFQRAWSSNAKRCSDCRDKYGSGRVSKIGQNHDYGLNQEKLTRRLNG